MIAAMNKLLNPLRRTVGVLVNRAVVTLVSDTFKTQSVQIVAMVDEVRDAVEHMQPAGFKSVPLAGSEAIVLAIGGNGDHRVAVMVHHKDSRPQGWDAGDVGIYHQVTGDLIRIKADGSIEITAKAKVVIKAPTVRVEGNIEATGQISDAQGSMSEMRIAHNAHNHPPEATAPPSSPMV